MRVLLGVADHPKVQPFRQLRTSAFEFPALLGIKKGIGGFGVEPRKRGIEPVVSQMPPMAGQDRLILRGGGIVQQVAFIAKIRRCQPYRSANKAAYLLEEGAALLLVGRPTHAGQNGVDGLHDVRATRTLQSHCDKLQKRVVVVWVKLLALKFDLYAVLFADKRIAFKVLPLLDDGEQGTAGKGMGDSAGIFAEGQGEMQDFSGGRRLRRGVGGRGFAVERFRPL